MIIKADLGGWRLTKCKGSYRRGFKPIEEVPKDTPLAAKKRRNNAYIRKVKTLLKRGMYGVGVTQVELYAYHFPHEDVAPKTLTVRLKP